MEEFYPFFLIIFVGVFFSMVFRRMHFPWVVGLILGGMIIGPHALNILEITPVAEFLGQIGLVFLMFMAGLETKFSNFRNFRGGLIWLSFINGAVPFAVGVSLAILFGYGWVAALLVGIIFISSSIAVVIPSLERFELIRTRLGQSVIMTTVSRYRELGFIITCFAECKSSNKTAVIHFLSTGCRHPRFNEISNSKSNGLFRKCCQSNQGFISATISNNLSYFSWNCDRL
jgi:Kef-type K+ transport system membrane component KefB